MKLIDDPEYRWGGEENLLENEAVPEGVCCLTRGMEPTEFYLKRTAEESSLQTRQLRRGHARLVDPIPDAWNGREQCRLEDLSIFQKAEWVTRPIANGATTGDDNTLNHALPNH